MLEPAAFDVMRPGVGKIRLVRSLAVALVCTATASFAHLLADGVVPILAVFSLFATATAVAWLVAARRLTPGQMVGLLVLCQVAVHLGCSAGSMTMSASMIATHVVATGVSALALARGEAFVWNVADRLGMRLSPLTIRPAAIPSHPDLVPVTSQRSRRDVRLRYSRALRGPPYGFC